MIDFAIVGAGISGLSAAWFLRQQGFSVRVAEAGPVVGGTMRTITERGFLVEGGPNSTLENTDALGELIRGVGLAGELQGANPAASRRYILKQGRLLPMPAGPLSFLATPLFSTRGKLRLLAEPFIGRAAEEESVAAFVRRRLGTEFLDWAIDPFVSGVYAGDPERLSVRFATRKIHALEVEYGSLFVGALGRLLAGRRSGPAPSGRMISFSRGMQSFPRAVAADLGDAVICDRGVTGLGRGREGWTLKFSAERDGFESREVVLALPADRAARLLAPLSGPAATALESIDYPPVASVALGFERHRVGHPLDGFGFLVPGREGRRILGTLFSSTLFPGRAPDGQVLLTSFVGGARNRWVSGLGDAELIDMVRAETASILSIEGEPVLARVQRWPRAIPQYNLGHGALLERLQQQITAYPGLHLRSNWLGGISVADCVRNSREFAQAAAAARDRT